MTLLYDMKTITTREFIRNFSKGKSEHYQVKDRGRVVGTWTPTDDEPPRVDFMARLKRNFKKPLPFTGAELLKEGKR